MCAYCLEKGDYCQEGTNKEAHKCPSGYYCQDSKTKITCPSDKPYSISGSSIVNDCSITCPTSATVPIQCPVHQYLVQATGICQSTKYMYDGYKNPGHNDKDYFYDTGD